MRLRMGTNTDLRFFYGFRMDRAPDRAHADIRVLRPGAARAVDEVLDGVRKGGTALGERLAVDLEPARGAWKKSGGMMMKLGVANFLD